MNRLATILGIFCIALLASCGGGSDDEEIEEVDVEKNPLKALVKMGQEMEKQAKAMEERSEDGNLEAMHYEDLYAYLPSSVSGYEKGEPDGATLNMQGMSYSSASVDFTDGDDRVKVTILDYNLAMGLYTMATSVWAMGISVDSPEEKASGIKLGDNISGWQVYKKKSKDASVMLGIGGRFMVSVEANNQGDTEFVKEIAGEMNLGNLAEL